MLSILTGTSKELSIHMVTIAFLGLGYVGSVMAEQVPPKPHKSSRIGVGHTQPEVVELPTSQDSVDSLQPADIENASEEDGKAKMDAFLQVVVAHPWKGAFLAAIILMLLVAGIDNESSSGTSTYSSNFSSVDRGYSTSDNYSSPDYSSCDSSSQFGCDGSLTGENGLYPGGHGMPTM